MADTSLNFGMTGKVSLVTGAGRGIGANCAEELAKAGSKVILTDILKEDGEATVERINNAGGEAIFVLQDVTDEDEWKFITQKAVDTYGGLDVVVNNAGIEGVDLVENITLEKWRQVMAVNADGVFLGTKHAILAMKTPAESPEKVGQLSICARSAV